MAAARHRVRRTCAWAGLAVVGLTLCLELASVWLGVEVPFTKSDSIVVSRGVVGVVGGSRTSAWQLTAADPHSSEPFRWWFESEGIYGVGWIVMPIWFVAALAAGPTAWLWWRDRRFRRRGRCGECGYDLSGLPVGAPCPECGAAKPDA